MFGIGTGPIISLSIEGWTLRVMETRGRRIVMWANIPLSSELIREGLIADANGLGKIIGETIKAGGLSKRRVVCAVNVPHAVPRMFTVPKDQGANLANVVDRELHRQIPAAKEDSFVYWQAVEGKSQTQQQIYSLTVPKEPLLTMLASLKVAGVRPYSMDLRTLALARSINQKDAILANLEANTADVVLIVDDIPVMMRSIYLGDEPASITSAQDRLLGELSRSLSFYNDTNRANPLAPTVPIYLTGELAGDSDLVQPVKNLTGHPVSVLDPPMEYPPDFPGSLFMVNIGLALKEL